MLKYGTFVSQIVKYALSRKNWIKWAESQPHILSALEGMDIFCVNFRQATYFHAHPQCDMLSYRYWLTIVILQCIFSITVRLHLYIFLDFRAL